MSSNVAVIVGTLTSGREVVIATGAEDEDNHVMVFSESTLIPVASARAENVVRATITYSGDPSIIQFAIVTRPGFFLGTNSSGQVIITNQVQNFTVSTSSVDMAPRSQMFAGALYKLSDGDGNIVTWRKQQGSLIVQTEDVAFLPTTWYNGSSNCRRESGVENLLVRLQSQNFRGFATLAECERGVDIIYCTANNRCGDSLGGQYSSGCLGLCWNTEEICEYNSNSGIDRFLCHTTEELADLQKLNLSNSDDLSPSALTGGTPSTSSTSSTSSGAWWWVLGVIILVVLIAIIVVAARGVRPRA